MVFFYAFGGEEREEDVGWHMAREDREFGVCVLTMIADLSIDPRWDMTLPATVSLLDDLRRGPHRWLHERLPVQHL
eukprot:11198737-Lingulodinium_polyedra.AAC.1